MFLLSANVLDLSLTLVKKDNSNIRSFSNKSFTKRSTLKMPIEASTKIRHQKNISSTYSKIVKEGLSISQLPILHLLDLTNYVWKKDLKPYRVHILKQNMIILA